ncbi:MAG TPA: hypothetical protein VHX86_02020 [Tepidisphaeraceae bacterium]|jgi:hypothetical protein|nr:hypothetical protein [Tepidisphaeraceae bacterium]
MPHAFNASPDHPAVDYLVRLHADLGGKILENRKEAKRLADTMIHVEAVIRIFDPAYSVRAISARRRQRTNPWFKRGTLFREALGVLRKATGPMTVREITDAVLAAKGVTGADKRQRLGVEAGVRSSLEDHSGKDVQTVDNMVPKRWKLA